MPDEQKVSIQVGPEHYASEAYLDEQREASYRVQQALLDGHGPVLEIGIGPGVLARRLRDEGTRVVTADIDPRLGPDLACSITALPFREDAFESVAAFEVLEHLPLPVLDEAIAELCRVASDRVVVSVPEKEDKLATFVSLNVLGREWDDPEHHWELGLFVSKLDFLARFHDEGFGLGAYDGSMHWHRFFVFTPEGVGPLRGRAAMLRERWTMDG